MGTVGTSRYSCFGHAIISVLCSNVWVHFRNDFKFALFHNCKMHEISPSQKFVIPGNVDNTWVIYTTVAFVMSVCIIYQMLFCSQQFLKIIFDILIQSIKFINYQIRMTLNLVVWIIYSIHSCNGHLQKQTLCDVSTFRQFATRCLTDWWLFCQLHIFMFLSWFRFYTFKLLYSLLQIKCFSSIK